MTDARKQESMVTTRPPFPKPARAVRWHADTCTKCPSAVGFCLRLGFCSRAQRAERLLERRAR